MLAVRNQMLLNAQHFAEDWACGRPDDQCASVVYEWRSGCSLSDGRPRMVVRLTNAVAIDV